MSLYLMSRPTKQSDGRGAAKNRPNAKKYYQNTTR